LIDETRSFTPARELASTLLCVLAISTASILVRFSDVGPSAAGLWRFVLALPILLIALLVRGQAGACLRAFGRHSKILAAVGVCFAAHILLFYWSLRFTSVANACSLVGTSPIFVALGSFLLFRSRPSAVTIVGILVACCGTALLTQPRFQLHADHLLGNGLAILAAVAGAGYLIFAERARQKLPSATVMFWTAVIVCLALLPMALLSAEPLVPRSPAGWLPLLGLALVSQILGHGLLLYSLSRLPALSSAIVLLLEPVVASGMALVLLGESILPGQALSALLVVGGAVVGQLGQLATSAGPRPAPASSPPAASTPPALTTAPSTPPALTTALSSP
jgi:drug/metabolite transporter (DMT)-like permease